MSGGIRSPVSLITGFLGSGKTTLLSRMLMHPDFRRTAVIINEFGEIPLDQALIERTDGPLVVLSGGCLCCAVTGDIVSTLLALLGRRAECPFDRIVIETSGLADPGPILAPLMRAPELTPHFRVGAVVAVVDALQGLRELDRQRVSARQVAMADRILLSKTDIGSPHGVARLKERLGHLNPWAPLSIANHGEVAPEFLLEMRPYPVPAVAGSGHAHHDHGNGAIRSFCLWFDDPVEWDCLSRAFSALTEEHGEKILRLKGMLAVPGRSRPVVVHGVGHFLHVPEELSAWPDQDRRSRLLFITEGVDETTVRRFFPSS